MNQLYESAIAICTIGLAILLFYVAYFCCKRYATDSESVDIEDYIANQSHTIFKERVFLVIQFRTLAMKKIISLYNMIQ